MKKEQVLAELRKRLQNGKIPPGSKLKSGVQLAQEFNVSHITMRSVLRELSLAGELVVVHGRGTFAPEAPVRIAPKILVIRLGAGFEHPGHYIMPEFIARTNELGGSVTEINVQFIRNNPSETMVTVLRNSGYTGVLLDGSSYTGKEPELKVLRQLNLPVILSHANSQDAQITGYPALGCNLKQAWKDGLESICATGRKRIALLLCPHGRNIYRGRTIEEHLQLLKECGADSDPEPPTTIRVFQMLLKNCFHWPIDRRQFTVFLTFWHLKHITLLRIKNYVSRKILLLWDSAVIREAPCLNRHWLPSMKIMLRMDGLPPKNFVLRNNGSRIHHGADGMKFRIRFAAGRASAKR